MQCQLSDNRGTRYKEEIQSSKDEITRRWEKIKNKLVAFGKKRKGHRRSSTQKKARFSSASYNMTEIREAKLWVGERKYN